MTIKPRSSLNSDSKTTMLIVLDGWGYRTDTKDNAILSSKKPFFDLIWNTYPHSLLKASGNAVGLPEGQMGNSEVGHTTIGAGSIVDTDLVRIDKAIHDGEFEKSPSIQALFIHVKKYDSTLHVQGLVSPGGVHSHQEHLFAFLKIAKKSGVPKVAIHVFTDGRDTPPQSASEYLRTLENVMNELNKDEPKDKPRFFIATISGRYFAMDRDHNWDRLAKTEKAMFECAGNICGVKPSVYMDEQYKAGKNDELLEPTVCATPEGTGCAVEKDDAVFFFNFRADRARMISEKLISKAKIENILFVTLTEYSTDFACEIVFSPIKIESTLGQEISKAGLEQAHIAETEKFAHATYFLNGGREAPYDKERDILLPSRKDVKTHDQAPEMRAQAIADVAIEEINKKTPFIFINFANPDMVGHTANVPAIITAVETVDRELKRVITALTESGGKAIIIADHGNAEINIDPITGTKHTSHTTSLVPCILTSHDYKLKDGGLSDIAPTILELMNIKKPEKMTGNSLLK